MDHIKDASTPFNAIKTAEQHIQFGIDPTQGLSRRRYGWYSNNTLFDTSLFSENDNTGLIDIDTTASATDTARIRSALVGRYISQTLAQPGVGLTIGNTNVSLDADNQTSLSHGTIAVGAGWHSGTTGGWGVGTDQVHEFLGFVFDETGAYSVLISNGQHLGDSPVPQEDWNIDSMTDDDHAGAVFDPSNGYVYNFPYSWYAFNGLRTGFVDPWTNNLRTAHHFSVDGPSLSHPSLTPMVIVDNDGTADPLSCSLGGLEFGLYGADALEGVGEIRATEVSRIGQSVGTAVVTTDNAVDPPTEPGVPLVAFRRNDPNAVRDLSLAVSELVATPDSEIYVYSWDEYDSSALDGTWRDPHEPISSSETQIQVNSSATAYTPGTAVARGWDRVPTEKQNDPSLTPLASDDRVPIDATRVYTAVHNGSPATVDFRVRVVEGY